MNAQKKRKTYISIFAVCFSFSLVLFAAVKTAQTNAQERAQVFSFSEKPVPKEEVEETRPAMKIEETIERENAPLCLIRLVGNELRLIEYGREENYHVLQSADPRTFREQDRQRLTEGVEIYTMEDLALFMEDYSS